MRPVRARKSEPTSETLATPPPEPPAPELEVRVDPPPPAAAPPEPPAPAPENMPPAPEAAPPAELPELSSAELRALAGEAYVTLLEFLVKRRWPDQPLQPEERERLSATGGQLIAHYLPDTLSPVHLLWANAAGALALTLGPHFTAKPPASSSTPEAPSPEPVVSPNAHLAELE